MEINNIQPKIRHLNEMKEILFDQEYAKTDSNPELYYMYRDLTENEEDKKKTEQHKSRYDITVMKSVMSGKENNKTDGHYHR